MKMEMNPKMFSKLFAILNCPKMHTFLLDGKRELWKIESHKKEHLLMTREKRF